jgi:DNA-binding response OmpR family regulator
MGEDRAANVLVVDDEADGACVLAMGLLMEGFEVETASDAEAALLVMAGGTFDFAVVDLKMPGTNGIELARMIRAQFPCAQVVLMSAYHLSERQLVLADCGVVGFVPKPFDLSELASFLRSKLARDPAAEVAEPKNDAEGPTLSRRLGTT